MTESEIIKHFNLTHDVYATIDRNPMGINQVIMVKGNVYRIKKLANEVTEDILEEMLNEDMVQVFGKEAVMNYCLINSFKYEWRRKDKENESQDVQKALWYFDKYKQLLNG